MIHICSNFQKNLQSWVAPPPIPLLLRHRHQFFDNVQNCGYLLKKHAELRALFWENVRKLLSRGRICKVIDDFAIF